MKNFSFNKIYVLESLPAHERHTGKELYDDLIARMPYFHSELLVDYRSIDTILTWDNVMQDILLDCEQNKNVPILHFEVHGDINGRGLVTSSKQLVTIEHVGEQLREINVATGCNLLITLGVCKGLYLLFNMLLSRPMPFIGAVGSFDDLNNNDIYLRYYDFYDTFFRTLDIGKSLVALQNANPDMPSSYRYIAADELFYKNYQIYLDTQCTPEALQRRAQSEISKHFPNLNRNQRREKERLFISEEKRSRARFFKEHASIFFMLENYPENKERFDVPSSFAELKNRYQNLVTI